MKKILIAAGAIIGLVILIDEICTAIYNYRLEKTLRDDDMDGSLRLDWIMNNPNVKIIYPDNWDQMSENEQAEWLKHPEIRVYHVSHDPGLR